MNKRQRKASKAFSLQEFMYATVFDSCDANLWVSSTYHIMRIVHDVGVVDIVQVLHNNTMLLVQLARQHICAIL